jgi:septal ring factor EnvC (AmiA/AmiB activator)
MTAIYSALEEKLARVKRELNETKDRLARCTAENNHKRDKLRRANERIAELEAIAGQAISDLQGVANLSVDSESHDEIVAIVQHVAAQFEDMKE